MLFVKRLCWGLCLAVLPIAACGDDDDAGTTPGALSQLNEACQTTADCAQGLACLVFSAAVSTCRPVTAEQVTPNDKECAAIQCNEPKDCCANFTRHPSCASWQASCTLSATVNEDDCLKARGPLCVCADKNYRCEKNRCLASECSAPVDCCAVSWNKGGNCASDAAACAAVPSNPEACADAAGPVCVCNATVNNVACQQNRCVSANTCTSDANCLAPNSYCNEGRCVQCKVDADCPSASTRCVANVCVTPQCKSNADCPPFSACQPDEQTGIDACATVGCKTDRECMTHEENYLAKCDLTASPLPTCVIQCDRDAQCASTSNPLRKCITPAGAAHGVCKDPGCDSDEECKIRLELVSQLPSGTKAVCRDKVAAE